MSDKIRVLFVCKFNQTRSQIARAVFKKLNKNKNIKVDSAGIIKPTIGRDFKKDLKILFKKNKLKYKKLKRLSKKLLSKQDYIIIVADDVPPSLFSTQKKYGIKVIRLKVKDGHKYKGKNRLENLEKVYLNIEKEIKKLISSKKINSKNKK